MKNKDGVKSKDIASYFGKEEASQKETSSPGTKMSARKTGPRAKENSAMASEQRQGTAHSLNLQRLGIKADMLGKMDPKTLDKVLEQRARELHKEKPGESGDKVLKPHNRADSGTLTDSQHCDTESGQVHDDPTPDAASVSVSQGHKVKTPTTDPERLPLGFESAPPTDTASEEKSEQQKASRKRPRVEDGSGRKGEPLRKTTVGAKSETTEKKKRRLDMTECTVPRSPEKSQLTGTISQTMTQSDVVPESDTAKKVYNLPDGTTMPADYATVIPTDEPPTHCRADEDDEDIEFYQPYEEPMHPQCRLNKDRMDAGPHKGLCACLTDHVSLKREAKVLYCQAQDSVDGQSLTCGEQVMNDALFRPSLVTPYCRLCNAHQERLRNHACCPVCGQFCTQGTFVKCLQIESAEVHLFHEKCMLSSQCKNSCPHCRVQSVEFIEITSDLAKQHVDSLNAPPVSQRERARIAMVTNTEEQENGSSVDDIVPKSVKLEDALGKLRGDRLEKCKAATNGGQKGWKVLPKNLLGAAQRGDIEKILYFLTQGLHPQHAKNDDGATALHSASEHGQEEALDLLLQAGGRAHSVDKYLRTPLMDAAENGHLGCLKILVQAGAIVDHKGTDGMTSLILAAQRGHQECVKFLFETGHSGLNATDGGGWTALVWACEYKHVSMVKYLLSLSADAFIRDQEGNIALHWAAFSGEIEILKMLLNAGSDANAVNNVGDTALHITARQDNYAASHILLVRGANTELKNNENDIPLECCVTKTSQTYMLLRLHYQLRELAKGPPRRREKLLHRDISMGRERHPIPVVNGLDDDNYPTDFQYVVENVITLPINVNRTINSLQSCSCEEDCAWPYCKCATDSMRCWYDSAGRLIDTFCYHDPPLIFECNKACKCWYTCRNRVVQRGSNVRLEMFKTKRCGWGVRPQGKILKGTYVCEYIGEHIPDDKAEKRADDSYLFNLDKQKEDSVFCVDGKNFRNIGPIINHLCNANLTVVKVHTEHQDLRFPHLCLFANKDIAANEELGFNYGHDFWKVKEKQFTCQCGYSKCKFSKDTIAKTLREYAAALGR